MRKLRILALMHEDLVPPDSTEGLTEEQIQEWKTEFDVTATLSELGHDVFKLGVWSDLGVINHALSEFRPQVVFNLLEEFHGITLYDQHVAAYLELMKQPYTGCNPRGLLLARDKALAKQILQFHRIPTPQICGLSPGPQGQSAEAAGLPVDRQIDGRGRIAGCLHCQSGAIPG